MKILGWIMITIPPAAFLIFSVWCLLRAAALEMPDPNDMTEDEQEEYDWWKANR